MVISYDMTTCVRFCLLCDPLKWDFIAFRMNNMSGRKQIVHTDVVSDVIMYVQKCYYMCVHMIFI